jgi:hypothetical protein
MNQTKMFELRARFTAADLLSLLLIVTSYLKAESAIGVNWGTISFHRLKPSTVVDLLNDNRVQKVKLFEAEPDVMKALMGSGIQVMVGIPNEMLASLSSSTLASDLWVRQNVSRYTGKGGIDIRYRPALVLCFFFFFSVVWACSEKKKKKRQES